MAGEDIEVTTLVKLFPGIKGEKNLITRSMSRGVVADCFHLLQPDTTYAIVGNPGIGKSWTLLYALQQALLYENSLVLLFLKSKEAIVCIRRNHKIYVWRAEFSEYRSSLFKNSNVLALMAPPEEGTPILTGLRRCLYSASNNIRHFTSQIQKDTPLFKRTLSPPSDKRPPSDKQLVVLIPYRQPGGLDINYITTVLERRKIVCRAIY
jgi:hypothetical protein